MVFRKICQIFGVFLVGLGIWFAWNSLITIMSGEIAVLWGVLAILFELAIVSGVGMLFIIFDPHQVIQSDSFSLHRLVQPRRDIRSFGQKIGAGEDDD